MDTDVTLEVFINNGLIDKALARDVKEEMSNSGKEIWETLVDFGVIGGPEDFWSIIATEVGAQFISLDGFVPPQEVLDMIPAGQARMHGALPIEYREGDGLYVCLEDPLNPQTIDDLRIATGQDIYLYVAADYEVRARISEYYGGAEAAMGDLMNELGGMNVGSQDGAEEANAAPVIKFVNLVIMQAIKEKASDIHLEPFEHEFKIRYRVDGALYEMQAPPPSLANSVISRVKVMAGMNIAERRVPQDGRIVMKIGNSGVDMRVNSLPTQYGESVVMRVLDRNSVSLNLDNLNLSPKLHEYIIDTVNKPNGIFVVTGPTGSGKTTTLYAALREINTVDTKILTAEDPVEYDIDGIVQVPINEGIGVTFPRVLRAFLRQDPDRILVGEIRDQDTAQIAIQAALTGHLVLSTLHTNDAAGAVARFIDMGVQPFLLSATILGVLAQRLVRTICPYCKTPYTPSNSLLNQLGINPALIGQQQFFTGARCDKCAHTGYKGRKGIHELLNASDPIRELITQNVPSIVLKQKAIELGMSTLREDGIQNIFEGNTTIEEVLKYT
ncbi:MAG: Flp pilus assembly complex ATPase component TadA [Akkermansia sp.]|nr:Flp pilus assembly complex ATPase component TadA [Akkermansia sp.]MBQ4635544.1 Flp pilus assembly complex ATPase component TadA [Akkermansia sp.]MBQ9094830.1 Flp pilus assembly complex ATPase component TadA [Akkermansia sp.]MBR1997628.1 Flp pilus assembly complex ATPase component TadA [Akkermansia sp.]MBR3945252.1 Flp pilus assembly complex ATPase component TadA [Akkermansia sp.]